MRSRRRPPAVSLPCFASRSSFFLPSILPAVFPSRSRVSILRHRNGSHSTYLTRGWKRRRVEFYPGVLPREDLSSSRNRRVSVKPRELLRTTGRRSLPSSVRFSGLIITSRRDRVRASGFPYLAREGFIAFDDRDTGKEIERQRGSGSRDTVYRGARRTGRVPANEEKKNDVRSSFRRRLPSYLRSALDDVGANSRRKTYKQKDSFREEATGGLVSRITLCQMPIIFTRRWQLSPEAEGKVSASRQRAASISPKGETALTRGTILSWIFTLVPDGRRGSHEYTRRAFCCRSRCGRKETN